VPGGARGFLMRGGLLTYGIEPFRGAFDGIALRPILSWRARVTLIRDFEAAATIGYGQTYTVHRPSRIATIAVGYADGLSRRLSNLGEMLIRGRRCPIVGRVSMDQCQVDVTAISDEIAVGDVATIVGVDRNAGISVLSLAHQIGTTPHEPTSAISARVPRIYL
jgi:alanine racemase